MHSLTACADDDGLEMLKAAAKAHLLIYKRCYWQAVKAVCERPPEPDVISPLALIIKPIDSVDGGAFVIAPQQKEVFWVFDLQEGTSPVCELSLTLTGTCTTATARMPTADAPMTTLQYTTNR